MLRRSDVDHERDDVEHRGNQNSAKRNAEPVALGKERVTHKKQQAETEQEAGLQEKGAVEEREVAVDGAKKERAVAVARVESDPGFPHGRLARDDRRDL